MLEDKGKTVKLLDREKITFSRGYEFDPHHFHNFKSGLDLEQGSPSLMRTTG